MPPQTPQPSNSQIYQKSLVDAREAWAQKSGLTQAQVKGAYNQAAVSLASRVASAPPTAPSTKWNLSQYQQVISDYANSLDQRVIDAMHAGIYASYHDSADSVLKAKVSDAYGSVFGPEAIDAHVRGVNQAAAASFITRTGKDGIKLSDRIWKSNVQWRQATQQVVQSAVIAGQPPVQVARQIEQYLQPGVNVPYKEETAKRLRVPKDTSMPAMRVARTEMQNAFHEGTISAHGSMPSYLGIRWHVSEGPGHIPDECDDLAAIGFFPKGQEPLKPHPHCFCTALPVHREFEDVLDDLDEWLANPSSHPELQAYYKELLPLLDVEIASVSGGAGGNLLGGYAKGEKVLIKVGSSEVIATITGEHASKGVLVMKVDPGQGMESVKVWRAPSKVKLYTGPPAQNIPLQTGPPPTTLTTGHTIQVGDTVYATVGQHLGKVGTIDSINQAGGTYKITWTDGSSNNVVWQNISPVGPAPSLLPGDTVKLHLPEMPALNNQIATISKINADGGVTVAVAVGGVPQAFDLPLAHTFKAELQQAAPAPPQIPTVVGLKNGDYVLVNKPGHALDGLQVKLMGGITSPTINVPVVSALGVEFMNAADLAPVPTPPAVPTPPPTTPTPVGYVNEPGSSLHGKAVAKIDSDTTIQFMDGTWAYAGFDTNAQKWDISPTDPTLAPPTPPPTPSYVPPPAAHQFKLGDNVQIDSPGMFMHGQQGTITAVTPTGVMQVQMHDGTHEYFSAAEAQAGKIKPLGAPPQAVGPQVPTIQGIDHLKKGDTVEVNDPGSLMHGQKLILSNDPTQIAGADVMVYAENWPNDLFPYPKAKLFDPAAGTAPAVASRNYAKLDDLIEGDQVKVLDSNSPAYGKTMYLAETPAWYVGTEAIAVYDTLQHAEMATNPTYVVKALLAVVPGTLQHAQTPLHQLVAGDEATFSYGPHQGKTGVLQADILGKQPGAIVGITLADGTTVDAYISQLKQPPLKAKAKQVEDTVFGDELVITNPNDPDFGKSVTLAVPKWETASNLVDVKFADGTIGTLAKTELGMPPAPGTAPGPAPVAVQPVAGTPAQVNIPGDPLHGEQVMISQDKPGAGPTTPIKVMVMSGPAAGTHDFVAFKDLVAPGASIVASPTPAPPPGAPPVLTPPPGAVIDVTQKGTKVTTEYKGQQVTGTVTSYNAGKNVITIKPDDLSITAGAVKDTFTKSPSKVQAVQPPGTAPAPTQTTPPAQTNVPGPTQTPPTSVHHLKAGDIAVVNMPGSIIHGDEVKLMDDAGPNATDVVQVVVQTGVNAGHSGMYYLSDLLPPGAPMATTPPSGAPVVHAPEPGGKATYAGLTEVTLMEATTATSWKVELPDGAVVSVPLSVLTDIKPPPVGAPPPVVPPPANQPPPPPVVVTQSVTDKGAVVTTDYQGTLVTATVTSFNANKNVIKLKPVTPIPGVPNFFEKSPKKVTLVPQPGVTPAPAPLTPAPQPAAVVQQAPQMPTSLPVKPPPPNINALTKVPQPPNVGGGHVKAIYKAADGETWMFKPDPNAANAELSGYAVQELLGLPTPEIHVMTVGGQVGSMQKFHKGIKGEVTLSGMSSLSAQQRAQIQTHQVVDWLISQHDSNDGAMLIGADDTVLAVDKGQAFKFLGRDKLDWTYKPNPNMLVYQPLFEGYIGGRYDLKRSDIEPIIAKVEALDDDLFKQALKPYAERAVQAGFVGTEQQIYDQLLARKHTIRADFEAMYDRADALAGRSSGTLLKPAAAPPKPPPAAVTATSAVTANHVTPIAQPLVNKIQEAGTHGTTIMVGGKDVENAMVHAYTIDIDGDGQQLVLQAKLRPHAEAKLRNRLEGLPAASAAPSAWGTSVATAPSDPHWAAILTSVKHIGYHIKGDGIITPSKVSALADLASQINAKSLGWTPEKYDYYSAMLQGITGIPDVATIAHYTPTALGDQIKQTWTSNTSLLSAQFEAYTPPPAAAPTAATAAPTPAATLGKFTARQGPPTLLKRQLKNGRLTSKGTQTTSSQDGVVGHHEWFVDDLGDGMAMQFIPAYGSATTIPSGNLNPYAKQGRMLITVKNFKGTPQEIDKAVGKLRELGMDSNPATPEDVELLYLKHQIYARKQDQSSKYQQMLSQINDSTPISEAVQRHRDFLSADMGVPDVTKLPNYDPTPKFHEHHYLGRDDGSHDVVQGAGRPYFERIDITRDDLKREMPGWVLTHSSTSGDMNFLRNMLGGNGMGSPTEERVRQALYDPSQGMSTTNDMYSGGASYFFTRLADTSRGDGNRGAFHFSTELLLHTDTLAYETDWYGQADNATTAKRSSDIALWKSKQRVRSNNEVIIKNGVPLLDYLESFHATSQTQRREAIKLFKDRGINEIRGKKIEDVIVVGH